MILPNDFCHHTFYYTKSSSTFGFHNFLLNYFIQNLIILIPNLALNTVFFAVVSIVTECYMPPCHVKYSPGACVHVSQIENPFERETMVCCKHIYSLCLFLRVAIKYNIAKILAN